MASWSSSSLAIWSHIKLNAIDEKQLSHLSLCLAKVCFLVMLSNLLVESFTGSRRRISQYSLAANVLNSMDDEVLLWEAKVFAIVFGDSLC